MLQYSGINFRMLQFQTEKNIFPVLNKRYRVVSGQRLLTHNSKSSLENWIKISARLESFLENLFDTWPKILGFKFQLHYYKFSLFPNGNFTACMWTFYGSATNLFVTARTIFVICVGFICDLLASWPVDFAADLILWKKSWHEGFVSLPWGWAEIYSRLSNNLSI
jgi:hypothetical protein